LSGTGVLSQGLFERQLSGGQQEVGGRGSVAGGQQHGAVRFGSRPALLGQVAAGLLDVLLD